jgi:glycosyltransferase involved in cell wall biosynthesis
MKILLVHNRYQQPGGEDMVFEAEARLLAENGCDVIRFVEENRRITGLRPVKAAVDAVWSQRSYAALRDLARRLRPDVAHFHNTLPLISPSAYYAVRGEGVAVVQTLHNYRLLCPNAQFLRDGAPCEKCVGRWFDWPAVKHRCYRDSRDASGVVAAMLGVHRTLGTWTRKIDRYIALTEFARAKFISGGLPGSKISVKPNFLSSDPPVGSGAGKYALFVGRLSPEKGIHTLLDAWRILGDCIPLLIVGDGPLSRLTEQTARASPWIRYLGRKQPTEIVDLMGEATCLVFPSLWYEGMPRTMVESFGVGTPIIASRMGAMISMVDHERTGVHFDPGNASDLAAKVEWLVARADAQGAMRAAARTEYEVKYRAGANYATLMQIYASAIASLHASQNRIRRVAL